MSSLHQNMLCKMCSFKMQQELWGIRKYDFFVWFVLFYSGELRYTLVLDPAVSTLCRKVRMGMRASQTMRACLWRPLHKASMQYALPGEASMRTSMPFG